MSAALPSTAGADAGRGEPRPDADAMLRRILPVAAAMGVTRVANLTGLDVLGVPVAAVTRPNSRSLAVHQGKGLTLMDAKVSALMEAAEAFHAETVQAPLRYGTAAGIGVETLDATRLARSKGGAGIEEQPILWIEGTGLASGRAIWVPFEAVHADYTVPGPPCSGFLQATTNGLGAGPDDLHAMLHALCEVIERDAVALWYGRGAALGPPSAVDPDGILDAAGRYLVARLHRRGARIGAWDATSDVGLPTFVCLLVPSDDRPDGVEPEIGTACAMSPAEALMRAVTEAAQARITRISGARDDYTAQSYGTAARSARMAEARRWLATARLADGRSAACRIGARDRRHDLDGILSGLAAAGCGEPAWVDLARPEIGLAVGRIVVPGLEGPWTDDGLYCPGARARAQR